MVLGVLIAREIHMLVASTVGIFCSLACDYGEDFFVLGHTERAACAEVVLDVHYDEGCHFLLSLYHIFVYFALIY